MTLRDELIQVAAVACAIVEDIDYGMAQHHLEHHGWSVIIDVRSERERQDEKWGPQHHTSVEWLMILLEEVGEAAKAVDLGLPPAGDGAGWSKAEEQEMEFLYSQRKDAMYVGQAAALWCHLHDWPDPKHRAIHREGGK